MTTSELLDHLAAIGVRVTVQGDRLRFEGATGRISAEVRASLTAHKADLLVTLTGDHTPAAHPCTLPTPRVSSGAVPHERETRVPKAGDRLVLL